MVNQGKEPEYIEELLVILTTLTIGNLLKLEDPADVISLYVFYYYCAKLQKTNQPKVLDTFVRKAFGWGRDRFERAFKQLYEAGLVEKVARRTKSGKFVGWYIKLNYIFTHDLEIHLTQNPQVGSATSGFQNTNALSNKKQNALNNKLDLKDPLELVQSPSERELLNASNRRYVPWKWRTLYVNRFKEVLKLNALDKSENLNRYAINRIFHSKLKSEGDSMEDVHKKFLSLIEKVSSAPYYGKKIKSFVYLESNLAAIQQDIFDATQPSGKAAQTAVPDYVEGLKKATAIREREMAESDKKYENLAEEDKLKLKEKIKQISEGIGRISHKNR